MLAKLIYTLSYVLTLAGSWGMIMFAKKFSFASSLSDYDSSPERLMRLSGYQWWKCSWIAIITGTVGQLVAMWMQ